MERKCPLNRGRLLNPKHSSDETIPRQGIFPRNRRRSIVGIMERLPGVQPGSQAGVRRRRNDGPRRSVWGILRSPRSSLTSLSMVVLPLPAWPCTPIARSFDNSTVRTASLWPRVRRDARSRATTASAPVSANPLPRPARIDASTRRSARTARSVTKARSIPRRSASMSSPPDASRAIAASTSASV